MSESDVYRRCKVDSRAVRVKFVQNSSVVPEYFFANKCNTTVSKIRMSNLQFVEQITLVLLHNNIA